MKVYIVKEVATYGMIEKESIHVAMVDSESEAIQAWVEYHNPKSYQTTWNKGDKFPTITLNNWYYTVKEIRETTKKEAKTLIKYLGVIKVKPSKPI